MGEDTGAARVCEVLIVEDDADDVFLLERALRAASQRRGVAVSMTHSADGMDALGVVARKDLLNRLPDVVIVDLNMPRVDGGRFLRMLRSDADLAGLPTAVLTTSTEQPVHDDALACGADVVFAKPESLDELIDIAGRILALADERWRLGRGGAAL